MATASLLTGLYWPALLTGLAGLTVVALLVCMALGLIRYLQGERRRQKRLVALINQALPQTQCGKCGHPGCLPYARAIAAGAAINQCPPGGHATIVRLATLLGEPPTPLNPAHGRPEPARVAFIREAECIGCKKCIRACPVDAILGSAKQMHTVIAAECTGCDLCVESCPVDCIDMITLAPPPRQHPLPSRLPNPLDALESGVPC